MKETGVSQAQLRARVRDDLRIESYLQQRFGASYQPGEDEVVRYYRVARIGLHPQRRAAAVRTKCATRCGTRLVDDRTAVLVRDWVAGPAPPSRCHGPAEMKSRGADVAGFNDYRSLNTLISGPGCSASGVNRITSWLCPNRRE